MDVVAFMIYILYTTKEHKLHEGRRLYQHEQMPLCRKKQNEGINLAFTPMFHPLNALLIKMLESIS